MCCLFGLLDYGHTLTEKQTNRIISTLATECEVRGTDATGIAYNSGGKLCVYKRPFPAHRMKFRIPGDAHLIMGHTRMTTQGSEKKNYNNHPFLGKVDGQNFALAHNGVLYNDLTLRREKHLPKRRTAILPSSSWNSKKPSTLPACKRWRSKSRVLSALR